jgi:cytochrome c-type protein NapB
VGAFYSLIGKVSLVKTAAVQRAACNDCMDCFVVCPEPQVIRPALKGVDGAPSGGSRRQLHQLRPLHRRLLEGCVRLRHPIQHYRRTRRMASRKRRRSSQTSDQPSISSGESIMKKSVTILLASLLGRRRIRLRQLRAAGLTMRGADVAAADKAPGELAYAGKRPGTQPVIARTFSTQPPLIPHAVDNFDEVTLTENQCLDCHGPDNYVKKTSPKLGDSHFRRRHHRSSIRSRHNCTQCHVPQVDAPALVENRFIGNIK